MNPFEIFLDLPLVCYLVFLSESELITWISVKEKDLLFLGFIVFF